MSHFKPRVFISGPMSGYEDFNYPAFHQAADQLKDRYDIISPAHNQDGEPLQPPQPGQEKPWDHYMRESLRKLMDAECIYMLPGWNQSRGARIEHHLAEVLNIDILNYADMEEVITL